MHTQREYEGKWQGWQIWTDEKLTTKLMKDGQQPGLLLPARWWPDTLPAFESEGCWQRPHTRVKYGQSRCTNCVVVICAIEFESFSLPISVIDFDSFSLPINWQEK